MPALPTISLQGVSKQFGDGPRVLEGVSLDVAQGEFVSLIGPSGCGKSTLLRVIAGLTPHSEGTATVEGHPPGHADNKVAFIFQEPTLLPWLRVQANVEVPLRLRHEPKAAREETARKLLDLVGLAHAANYFPRQLSGGMKMRVSIARALSLTPHLLLLDEPFAALDSISRSRLNEELLRLRDAQKWTALFVTHSVQEAVFLSDRIIVMAPNPGRIHASIPINLPHPRTPQTRESPDFALACAQVAKALGQAAEEGRRQNEE